MRALIVAVVAVLVAPAAAQVASTTSLEVSTTGLEAPTLPLAATVVDIDAAVVAIDLPVEDLVRVKEAAKEITLELPADVLFDFDKSDIRPDAATALAAAAEMIRTRAKGTVRIEGHTDSKGAASYNQKLSQARAKSVQAWLVANGGLAKVKFALSGYGATRPGAPNARPDGSDDPAGRQLNRRVAIVFTRSN
jgi:outer membrane protein OmpA-like peptidoglycan-associated protein